MVILISRRDIVKSVFGFCPALLLAALLVPLCYFVF